MYAFLLRGVGVGKSIFIRALYQALHWHLCSNKGVNTYDTSILLYA